MSDFDPRSRERLIPSSTPNDPAATDTSRYAPEGAQPAQPDQPGPTISGHITYAGPAEDYAAQAHTQQLPTDSGVSGDATSPEGAPASTERYVNVEPAAYASQPEASAYDAQPDAFAYGNQTDPAASAAPTNPAYAATATQTLPFDAASANGLPPTQLPPVDQGPAATPPSRRRQRRGPGWAGTLMVAVITALATLGASYLLWGPANLESLSGSGAQVATQAPVRQASAEKTNWEEVAKSVQPAVVAIQVASGSSGDTGSGVIFDAQGHILTNYHVIASAVTGHATITIELSNGALYKANIVGSDSTTDLAVLSIVDPPSNLQMVSLGSSSDLNVGQPVAAIGAPLGLENTMTTGIISALDRPVTVTQSSGNDDSSGGALGIPGLSQQSQSSGEQVITNAIQVDAAINPGNSGGPLFAADGSVIGITSSIASLSSSGSDSSGSIGIGFAIPVNLAKSVADQILSTGSAKHAFLGVTIGTASGTVDGKTVAGAQVASVVSGGAAEAAKIQKGDVITKIDNHTVTSGTALTGYVRWYVPGDKVKVTFVRDGESQTVDVTLGSAPAK